MKEFRLSFGVFKIVDNYIISEVDAGVDYGEACIQESIAFVKREFGDKPFGFISHRINDYSINPASARKGIKETNVVAVAFVLKRSLSFHSFESESAFYNIPQKVFKELENAEEWMKKMLEKTQVTTSA